VERSPCLASHWNVFESTIDRCWWRSLAWWRSPVCNAWFMVGEV